MSPPPPPDTAIAGLFRGVSGAASPLEPVHETMDRARAEIATRSNGLWLRQLLRSLGPGYLVAVGYMDPGNWATSLAGGSGYGYTLLWVVALSSIMAMFLQVLSARLGIVSGMDLAQACRRHSSRRSAIAQWLLCEVAICACDLAEVIGTAIALKLLFDVPLVWGVTLTVFDVLVILWLQKRGFRYLEALVISLIAIVCVCFGINLALAHPVWYDVLQGFVPTVRTVTDPGLLYIAIGIIGATVMPHNLYLHSSIVQTRRVDQSVTDKKTLLGFATIDIVIALCIALFINAAILITSAAMFHANGYREIAELQDAWRLLGPLTGTTIASVLFALALLASGQSSTLTATLAGQIVMEGYVHLKMSAWARRLLTRGIAVVPALLATLLEGDSGVAKLLILSQVILSLQLPFAIVPLIRYTGNRKIMGAFANSRTVTVAAIAIVTLIVVLDAELIRKALT